MATTISGSGLRKAVEVLREIQVRLRLNEAESERLLVRFRALPENHSARFALLRQLEIFAAIAGELTDLQDLIIGRTDTPDHTTELPARRGGPRE